MKRCSSASNRWFLLFFFFSSRRRHTRSYGDWSSDVCSSDLMASYDPKTALIVVDIQNDFADPKGSLYVREGEKVVDVANREADRARAAGALLVYTQDWHPEVTPHFKKFGGVWPVHCVRETWGAQPPPRLKVDGEILRKGTGGEDGYSGFTVQDPVDGEKKPTHLEALLRKRGIERVAI